MRSEPCNVGNSVNSAFLLDIQRDIEVLEEHEVFAGIITAQPLPIKQGQGISSGVEAIFNLECYKLAIAERGHYKAGCNLLWLNLTFSPFATCTNPQVIGAPTQGSLFLSAAIVPSQCLGRHQRARPKPD